MASKYDDDDAAYADSKYSDDGGESKTGGGGGGCAEAKGSSNGSSYEVGVVLPPIVQAFAHHVMSKKYRDAVERFFSQRCTMFQGVDPKAEQLLEYTEVYQAYVGVVEVQLEDFCAKHRVTSEELFVEVQDVMRGGNLDDEFLPAILRVAEYSYFMEQMVLTADHKTHIQNALQQAVAAASSGGGGEAKGRGEPGSSGAAAALAGVWRVDKKRTDFTGLDQYLAAIRVPVVFRGLAKGTFFSNKEVVVLRGGFDDTADSNTNSVSIVANSPFGMQRSDFVLDDRVHEVPNPWGASVPVRAAEVPHRGSSGGGGVEVEHCRPAHLPSGSAVLHTWTLITDAAPHSLRCSMEVREPGRSAVVFELFYAPLSAKDLEPKVKGPAPNPSKKGGKDGPAGGAAAAEAKGEAPVSDPGAK